MRAATALDWEAVGVDSMSRFLCQWEGKRPGRYRGRYKGGIRGRRC